MATPKPTWADLQQKLAGYERAHGELKRLHAEDLEHVEASDTYGYQHHVAPVGAPINMVPWMQWGVWTMRGAAFNGEEPRWTAAVAGAGKNGDVSKEAQRVACQAVGQAIIHWVWTHGAGESPLLDMAFQSAALGPGFLSYGFDRKKLPKEPDDKGLPGSEEREAWELWRAAYEDTVPLTVRSLPPAVVWFDPDNDPPTDYFVKEKVSRAALYELYGDKVPRDDSGRFEAGSRECTRIVYVSKEWCGEWVDEAPMLGAGDGVEPNTWGRVWIQMANSGLGYNDAGATLSSRYQGLPRKSHGAVLAALRQFNYYQVMRDTIAAGALDFEATAPEFQEAAEAVARAYKRGPFAVNAVPYGVRVAPSPMPSVPNVVGMLGDAVAQALEMTLGSKVTRGIVHGSNATVNAQEEDAAFRPYRPYANSCNQAAAQMVLDILHMIKVDMTDEAVFFGSGGEDGKVSIKPEQIPASGLSGTVDGAPPTLAQQQAQLEHNKTLLEIGALDEEQFYLRNWRPGMPEFESMVANRTVQRVRGSDAAMALWGERYAAMVKEELDALAAEQRAQDLADGILPPHRTPAVPPAPSDAPLPPEDPNAGAMMGQQGAGMNGNGGGMDMRQAMMAGR